MYTKLPETKRVLITFYMDWYHLSWRYRRECPLMWYTLNQTPRLWRQRSICSFFCRCSCSQMGNDDPELRHSYRSLLFFTNPKPAMWSSWRSVDAACLTESTCCRVNRPLVDVLTSLLYVSSRYVSRICDGCQYQKSNWEYEERYINQN